MSEKHCGYTVVLDGALRKEESERVIEAIKMIKGVVRVNPVLDSSSAYCGKINERHRIINLLHKLILTDIHGGKRVEDT